MAKAASKKNISSMQVLKTLQVLLQGNYAMNELLEIMNANEKEPIFNNSVLSKYINTCRYCGIEIPKIHNKYFVSSMPFGLDLTLRDQELLANIQNVVRNTMTKRYNDIFDGLIEKINRFSNKKIIRVEKNSYNFTMEVFERAIAEKRKVKLMLRNHTECEGIPLGIVENNGRTFFNMFYKNRERIVDIDRLSGIEVLNQKFFHNYSEQCVVFKLTGGLAQRYTLRENEQLISPFDGNCIVVSNRGENKEMLFSRLLRYDKDCEIINPKSYRVEMRQIITEALSNYGVNM